MDSKNVSDGPDISFDGVKSNRVDNSVDDDRKSHKTINAANDEQFEVRLAA